MEYIGHETSELADILLSNVPPEERIAFATSQTRHHQQQQHDGDLTWADLDLEILTEYATEPAAGETPVAVPKDGQSSDRLFAQIDTGAVLTFSADDQQSQHFAVDYHSCREDRLHFDCEWVAEPCHDQRLTDDAVVSYDQAQHNIAAVIHAASEHAPSTEHTHRIQPLAAEPYQQQQPSDVDVPSDQQLPSEERIAFAALHPTQQQQHDGDLTWPWGDLDLDRYTTEPAARRVTPDEQFSNGPSDDNTQSQWIQPLAAEPNQQQQQQSYVDGSSDQQQVSDTPVFNMTTSIAHGSVMMSQPDVNFGYQCIVYPYVEAQLLNPTQQCKILVPIPTVGTQLLQPVSGSSALYQCPHAGCTKTFKTRTSIQRHVNVIHAGIKAHACDLCGQRFGQKTHLTAHLRKHTGEQPFACLLCDKAYKHNVDLRKHMTSVHQLNITK